MLYYRLVCALLAAGGSRLNRFEIRLIVGFLVGLIAASLLPLLKTVLGV